MEKIRVVYLSDADGIAEVNFFTRDIRSVTVQVGSQVFSLSRLLRDSSEQATTVCSNSSAPYDVG